MKGPRRPTDAVFCLVHERARRHPEGPKNSSRFATGPVIESSTSWKIITVVIAFFNLPADGSDLRVASCPLWCVVASQ